MSNNDAVDYTLVGKGLTQMVPLVGFLDLEFGLIEPGYAEVLLPDRLELRNHIEGPHAGVMFSAAETASAAAFMASFVDTMATVTPLVERSEIAYKKIARGPLKAVARLVGEREQILETLKESGRTRLIVEVSVLDQAETEVAAMTFHWYMRTNK